LVTISRTRVPEEFFFPTIKVDKKLMTFAVPRWMKLFFFVCNVHLDASRDHPGANPTAVVKICNNKRSLVHFKNKSIFFCIGKTL
jgi:hypothetical protein